MLSNTINCVLMRAMFNMTISSYNVSADSLHCKSPSFRINVRKQIARCWWCNILVGGGGFVGCVRHVQVHNDGVDVARGDITSIMTQSGVTVGDCDVRVVTWCHRPRTCQHASNDCLYDACDCSDITRRKFCLFCKLRHFLCWFWFWFSYTPIVCALTDASTFLVIYYAYKK